MALVSDQLTNLLNGVSQQAVSMRLASQCEVQVNCLPSLVDGNKKRPPTTHVARVSETPLDDAYIHTINRDQNERYTVVVSDGAIRVFDDTGVERSVSYPAGTIYISGLSSPRNLRAVTVADYTFLVNTEKVVQASPDTSPDNSHEAMFFMRLLEFNATYKIFVDGAERAKYVTPSSSSTSVSVEAAMANMRGDLASSLGAGWTVEQYGAVIYLKKNDGTSFDAYITDTNGNSNTTTVKDRVQSFTDLPASGKEGFVIKVTGDEAADADDYYVSFSQNDPAKSMDDGVWIETIGPNVPVGLDKSTMPHTLVRLADGSFELRQGLWGDRVAGDLETASWPSFVDRRINDLYLDRRRLCLLTDDNVVMSRARQLWDFFPDTVITLLDDGPIETSASGSQVAILRHAIPFNKQVLIFSDQNQFVIEDEFLLASQPPELVPTTTFSIDAKARPVSVGRNVYFTSPRQRHTSLLEYYILDNTDNNDAADVTKHVPRYVPGGVFKITASSASDLLLAVSSEEPNRIYAYKFMWQGEKKVQSSWGYWEFQADAKVLDAEFYNDRAHLVIQYDDGVYLETLDVSEGLYDDSDERMLVTLDRRIKSQDLSPVYDDVTQRTTVSLPYSIDDHSMMTLASLSGGDQVPYRAAAIVSSSGPVLVVRGDWTSTPFIVGLNYSQVYEFSEARLRKRTPNGTEAAVNTGKLQLHRWFITFTQTGYFKVEVDLGSGRKSIQVFAGNVLGNMTLGKAALEDGTLSVRINGRNSDTKVRIINDSFLPSAFTGAEWEGRYVRNTSRL